MRKTIERDFKSVYKFELKKSLLEESNGRLKVEIIEKLSNSYVENLEKNGGFKNAKMMHKDPASIAADMVAGIKPEYLVAK